MVLFVCLNTHVSLERSARDSNVWTASSVETLLSLIAAKAKVFADPFAVNFAVSAKTV